MRSAPPQANGRFVGTIFAENQHFSYKGASLTPINLILEPCLMLLRRWFFTIREPVAGFRLSCRKKGSYQEENGYDQLLSVAKDVLIFFF